MLVSDIVRNPCNILTNYSKFNLKSGTTNLDKIIEKDLSQIKLTRLYQISL